MALDSIMATYQPIETYFIFFKEFFVSLYLALTIKQKVDPAISLIGLSPFTIFFHILG